MSFKRRPPAGNVRLVHSNGQSIRGVLTNKAGRTVQFESWLERALLLRLERDRTVTDYGSQPEVLHFRDGDGQEHTYVPDFIVWYCNGIVEIHEVSTARHQARAQAQQRMAAGRRICESRGWSYLVHDEKSLPSGSELANLLALAAYRPTVFAHATVTHMALEQLNGQGRLTLERLVATIGQASQLPRSVVLAGVCHLIWHATGRVTTDLNQLVFLFGAINPAAWVWQEAEDRRSS
jgi:hypothetical protein